jgi:hypothetical protein
LRGCEGVGESSRTEGSRDRFLTGDTKQGEKLAVGDGSRTEGGAFGSESINCVSKVFREGEFCRREGSSLVFTEAISARKKEASRDAVGCGEICKEGSKDVEGDLGEGERVMALGDKEMDGIPKEEESERKLVDELLGNCVFGFGVLSH